MHVGADRTPNRLIHEKSPYLQQHAFNPVDWYPWGEEAFDRARREEKPIFLSIGYSTCHWCHVMERESFEDPETALLMNQLFVNIKVDREERPDVDHVYMTAAQALNGNGGWPLSAWLMPDLVPFYVGTYFPPRPAFGRPSFSDALRSLHNAWINEREKVVRTSQAILGAIEKGSVIAAPTSEPVPLNPIVERCLEQLERSYDPRHGGFSGAPKFPRPSILEFLFRCHAVQGSERAFAMAHRTLHCMASGGMYDQLGGGFARYSVDAEWRVPHFEKMLYDQGQLVAACADAVRVEPDPFLEGVIRQTIAYLERDLMNSDGLFYSAEDADSEGEEGTFYVWTLRQLAELLTESEQVAMQLRYGLTAEGNFEHGRNVLHTSMAIEQVAARIGVTVPEVEELIAGAHARLFEARSSRPRPHRDEKILTSWNGLMLSGLARAAMALDAPAYAETACTAADLLLGSMIVDGRLMHRLKDGEVKIDGYLDDYAFLSAGLLDLYEATFDVRYLREADRLVRLAGALFWDEEAGGYFMASGADPSVLVRSKSDHDGAEPSGNSVMAMNLLRLGNLFHDEELLLKAERTIALFMARVADYPIMMPLMAAAALMQSQPPRQIVLAESANLQETAVLIRQARARYRPGTGLLLVPHEGLDTWLAERLPVLEEMVPLDGHAAAYVCERFVCQRPVTELSE
ncbi:MAG: thioredoxin domain-containing protein [Bacteroidetes bacterium]|nr:thioredoxin domain-containing protein [Bacteroidota bacterium]